MGGMRGGRQTSGEEQLHREQVTLARRKEQRVHTLIVTPRHIRPSIEQQPENLDLRSLREQTLDARWRSLVSEALRSHPEERRAPWLEGMIDDLPSLAVCGGAPGSSTS